jgi:hypothetical protein
LRCQQSDFPNPELRGADLPIQCHLYSTKSRGPTLPRHLGISRIANPRCKFSLMSKTPNAEPRSPGILCHLSCGDQRLRITREIATRDFNESAPHLVKRRMPICDGLWFFLRLWVNSPQLLHDPTISGISRFSSANPVRQFSSLKISSAPKLSLFESSPGSVPTVTQGTIPPELNFSHSFN